MSNVDEHSGGQEQTLFDKFTGIFGRTKNARIAALEAQVRGKDSEIGNLKTETANLRNLLEDRDSRITDQTNAEHAFAELLVEALGNAAPDAEEVTGMTLLAGVQSLRTQVDTLTEQIAPFREYIAEHSEAEAGDGDAGGEPAPVEDKGSDGEAPEDPEDERPRDERGRFVPADPPTPEAADEAEAVPA